MQSFQMDQWGKGISILLHMSETLEQNAYILYDFKTESNNNLYNE